MAVGLSILLAETYGNPNHTPNWEHMIELNMLIVRPVIKLSQTMIMESLIEPPAPPEIEPTLCYLKSCQFCHKKLQPQDDIYMYKGDQGYCTEECRSKQIKMDQAEEEADEREAYMTKLAIRRSSGPHGMNQNMGRCNETLSILRDLRHRRRGPVHLQRNGAIFF
ncbi:hypothetical protein QQ045_011402 [Rhodiola kirilowii]